MGIFGGNDKPKTAAKPAAKRATASKTAAKLAEGKPVKPSEARDTRSDQTPDAKTTQPAKREAAERQFAKADAKNEPTNQDNAKRATDDNPNIAAAKKASADNDKAVAQAEKDRRAAKVEAMKPATDEQIADATLLRAVRGY